MSHTARRRSRTGARPTGASTCTSSSSTARGSTTSTSARATVPRSCFVHGLGGCWQNWLENLPRAALDRRAIALDLPGFGRSEMPLDEISIQGYARVVDRFCERLGLGEVVLVGNSMGGFIAAEVAIRRPQRVERLVLVSAAGISIHSLHRRPVRTWGRAAVALGAYGAANIQATIVRPRLRHIALAAVVRHPTRLRAGHLLGDDERRRPQPWLHGRAERAPRLRLPRPPRRNPRCPR